MKKLKVSAAVFTAALVSTPCLSMEWNTEFSKMMNEQLQQYVGVSVNEYTVIQSASMTHNSFNNTLVKRSSYRVSLPSSDYDLSALKSSVKESDLQDCNDPRMQELVSAFSNVNYQVFKSFYFFSDGKELTIETSCE